MQGGIKYSKEPGSWFGPTSICNVLRDLSIQNLVTDFKIHVIEQGSIFIDSIFMDPPTHQTRVDLPKKNKGFLRNREPEDSDSINLFLIPLRLGPAKVSESYYNELTNLLKNPYSIGSIGGTPSHSLYFVGFHDQHKLVYLDPHTTQDYTDKSNDTFVNYVPYSTPISEIDPGMAFGFLTKNKDEFEKFKDSLETSKLIEFFEETPVFDFDLETSVI
jgi:cysteine protease ATG4